MANSSETLALTWDLRGEIREKAREKPVAEASSTYGILLQLYPIVIPPRLIWCYCCSLVTCLVSRLFLEGQDHAHAPERCLSRRLRRHGHRVRYDCRADRSCYHPRADVYGPESEQHIRQHRRRAASGASPRGLNCSPARQYASARLDAHVGAGRVLDRRELAVARVTRVDFAARVLAHPALPGRPPRILVIRGAFEPSIGGRR